MPAKDEPGAITPTAELKPLLHLARRQPLGCAIAMDKAKQGHVLMHRRTKPKKLLSELKQQAKAAGIELDPTTLRFGRASVDGGSDSGMVTFTVNKPAPGPMRRALLDQVRPAGLQRCEIVVDEALENETEDVEDEAGKVGEDVAGTRAGMPDLASMPAPTRADHATATEPGNTADALGAVGHHGTSTGTRLSALARRAADVVGSNPKMANAVHVAASTAKAALASGDPQAAGQAADGLEHLLNGTTPLDAHPVQHASGAMPNASYDPGAPSRDAATAPATDREGTDASGMGAPTTSQAARGVNGPLFAKGQAAWLAVQARLRGDIGAVLTELVAHYGEDDERVQAIHGRVEPVLRQLNDSLATALAGVAQAKTPDVQAAGLQNARTILNRYRTWVDEEPMVAELDGNPFHPVAMRCTLDAALSALGKAIGNPLGTPVPASVPTSTGPGAGGRR